MGEVDKKDLIKYVQWASNLAESIRRDIQSHTGKVSQKTVLALNEFTIAANAMKDVTDQLESEDEERQLN
jgi:hypothetical protein